jgi:hypothetical protein
VKVGLEPLPRQLLGGPRAARQILNHLARQPRRLAGPFLRQQIDEQPLARGHGGEPHLARQRKAQRPPVRIAPRRADVVARPGRKPVDRHVDRLLELDHQHIAGQPGPGLDFAGHVDDQAAVAAGCGDAGLAADGLGRRRVRRDQE